MARSTRRGRRRFLAQFPCAVAAGLAAPSLAADDDANSRTAGGPADAITTDMLASAQTVAGVALPVQELEQARVLVERNRANIDLLREVAVPSTTEPAFAFLPPRPPGADAGRAAAPALQAVTTAAVRPPRLEELAFAPVERLAALVKARRVSSVELTGMYLDRLSRADRTLHCVVTLTDALARDQAAAADRDIAEGRYRGPLHGLPYGIKDLFATKDIPTTWGAQPYRTQVFDYDATVVTRLRDAGAVLVAKLTSGELAVGDLCFGGRTRNPWRPDQGSSGSSAGPASATAAGLVAFAIGTETGGSIISPCATCGVVGLRPTYGRVPRTGCMTLRWTLDKVGPIARGVRDAALVLQAIAGPDGADRTVPDLPLTWDGGDRLSGMRVGVVARELDDLPADATEDERASWPARQARLRAAIDVVRGLGASIVPMALPALPASAVYAILNAEAGAMFDELVRGGGINQLADTGPNGRANQLRAARFIPAVEYIRAQRVRTLLAAEVDALFGQVDVFLAPSSSASVTITNLTGHPAAVVPAGLAGGLPVGLMVTGPLWREDQVLRTAAGFESATTWHTEHPPTG
ncbi:MAG: amidase [Vicinamibacterales bacterium]